MAPNSTANTSTPSAPGPVRIYDDYSRDKVGWFFGLSGWQVGVLAATVLPVFWALHDAAWAAAGLFTGLWALVFVLVAAPVRGRSATGWLVAATGFAVGGLTGWTSYRSGATRGHLDDCEDVELPGVLAGIEIHDAPPVGAAMTRVALIQDHSSRCWAATAALTHPGIGMSDANQRARHGLGLTTLLNLAARTGLITEILFVVRTVPDDGAERALYVQRHRREPAPRIARAVNDQLAVGLSAASVRTEAFCTIVVPERRLGREARESGGGLDGRAQVMHGLMGEVEAQLRGGVGMTQVAWLSSPELARACRTGFAPGDRAGIVEALGAHERDPGVNAEVPWALAGPSGAETLVRHYRHDVWDSVSATIKLPADGAVMGALAPVLTPGAAGERRSVLVAYPILTPGSAGRASANREWAADLGSHLRARAGVKERARQRDEAAKTRAVDAKLAHGQALTRPYAVCTVTVPRTLPVTEFGRRLDASIRRAGFAPLRLDLAQDAAFAAATIPLGISLTRTGDT